MGYTHYWRRVKELDVEKFNTFIEDCTAIIKKVTSIGIPIAGSHGIDFPDITNGLIAFNGLEDCGHESRNLGITWPSDTASGIGNQDEQVKGSWFAGAMLQHQSCGGDCSHESFIIERVYECTYSKPDDKGRYFAFCKTAYKPYDLAVVMCLLVAQHHFGNDIVLSSDGTEAQWADGCKAVRNLFGYEELAPR